MTEKEIKIGFDRFLALEWANYSMDLFLSEGNPMMNINHLKSYIYRKVVGTESARKTIDQLKRLWLNENDEYVFLRNMARDIHHQTNVQDYSLYHFGMAINVFPIFYLTCKKIGEICSIQDAFSSLVIISRVSQDFINPSSIPRIVTRVIQTLVDWEFVRKDERTFTLNKITEINNTSLLWIIRALLSAEKRNEISLTDLAVLPVKIGIDIVDFREAIDGSIQLKIRRGVTNN